MSTLATKWIGRQEVQDMLQRSGMPYSRPTLERLLHDPDCGFPQPRRVTTTSIRLWDRELVEAWIAKSRCSDLTPGEAA